MRITPGILVIGLAAAVLTGCGTERRIFITSEPTGALVHLNDIDVGFTPVEVDFTWYGEYDVRLEKDGFEPILTTAIAKAPLYETPVIDLAAGLIPVRKKSHIDWHYELQPANDDPDAVVERALQFRETMFDSETPEPGALPN